MNNKATILAVDDTSESLALLVRLLTHAGYQVRPADSGELALAAVAAHPPDLILLDVRMPGIDGLEVCRRLKAGEETRHIPIILISAFADVQEWVIGLQLGAADYITKPYQSAELLARVKTHLALGQANISLEQQAAALRQSNEQLQAESANRQRVADELRQSLDQAERSRRAMLSALEDQKRAEAALRESEERFRAVVQTATEGIINIDRHGRVTFWNEAAQAIFGYTAAEMSGQVLSRVMPERFRAIHQERMQQAGFTGEYKLIGKTVELTGLRKDGREFPLELSLATWQTGEGVFFTGIVRDITTRRQAEDALKVYSERLEEMVNERTQELRDAQEQLVRQAKLATLGQLAGSVGHELRNPLGVLSNAVYFLKMTHPDADETLSEYLGIISTQVRKSEKIISDLLNFARIKEVTRENVTAAALVAQVLAEQPPPAGIEVATQIEANLPPVWIDTQQIGQVLTNLVVNAYQAMNGGGKLDINARIEENKVALAVTDTGSGISPENMKKLFEPLFTTKAAGIGLGLAVSKNLVEANGGMIQVESKAGEGSVFTIILPTQETIY